jgi:hypothetical protein
MATETEKPPRGGFGFVAMMLYSVTFFRAIR